MSILAQFLRKPEAKREQTMRAAHHAIPPHLLTPEPLELTLLELVQAICHETDDELEIAAIVCHLLRAGRVRLCGNFGGSGAESFC